MFLSLPWSIKDLDKVPKNGYKVFSCFHCAGGSTMGNKLAGYEVLGGVEIDPKIMAIYKKNHKPKYSYLMGVQEFKNIPDSELPEELFNLDILEGSPPCSSFSSAGSREKKWGVEKKFREGQSVQILDDLFFDYIDIVKKLKPKVVTAENVRGLIIGNAKGYVKQIFQKFHEAGYSVQLFLLNAASMGVPQARERTFFIAHRNDLQLPKIKLEFNEKPISCKEAFIGIEDLEENCTEGTKDLWLRTKPGEALSSVHERGSRFNEKKLDSTKPSQTLLSGGLLFHWDIARKVNNKEFIRIQTFPDDFDFLSEKVSYVCGMSVPPFMMQRIAQQIQIQWLNKLKETSNG